MTPTRQDLLDRGLASLHHLRRVGKLSTDNFGAAWLGVLQSTTTWDPTLGASFETHCRTRAVGAVRDEWKREEGVESVKRNHRAVHHGDLSRGRRIVTWYAGSGKLRAALELMPPGVMAQRSIDNRDAVEYLCRRLNTREDRTILRARSRGWTFARIGLYLGQDAGCIGRRYVRIARALRAVCVGVVQ